MLDQQLPKEKTSGIIQQLYLLSMGEFKYSDESLTLKMKK